MNKGQINRCSNIFFRRTDILWRYGPYTQFGLL